MKKKVQPPKSNGKAPPVEAGPTIADRFRAEDYASQHPAHALVDVALGLRTYDPELADIVEAIYILASDSDHADLEEQPDGVAKPPEAALAHARFERARKKARAGLLAASRRLQRARDEEAPRLRFAGRTEIHASYTRKYDRVAAAKRLTDYVKKFLERGLEAKTIGKKVWEWDPRSRGDARERARGRHLPDERDALAPKERTPTEHERHLWIAANAYSLVALVAHVGLVKQRDDLEDLEESKAREAAQRAALASKVQRAFDLDKLDSEELLRLVLRAAGYRGKLGNFHTLRQ